MSAETKSPYNVRNPFQARCARNISLCGPGSDKDTRHIEISLAGSGLTYEAGDALAVKPVNDPALVELTLKTLGFSGDEPVKVKDVEKPVREALLRAHVTRASEFGPAALDNTALMGEILALRGAHFASFQFHPESILSRNGYGIIEEAARRVAGR